MVYELDVNEVKFLNGSTATFLSPGRISVKNLYKATLPTSFLEVRFQLSSKITLYNQYVEYQPVLLGRLLGSTDAANTNTITDSTSTTKEENRDSSAYFALFVMAQVGGLYSFLRLVFGWAVSLFADNLLAFEVINKLKSSARRNKTKRVFAYKVNSGYEPKIQPINLEDSKDEGNSCCLQLLVLLIVSLAVYNSISVS